MGCNFAFPGIYFKNKLRLGESLLINTLNCENIFPFCIASLNKQVLNKLNNNILHIFNFAFILRLNTENTVFIYIISCKDYQSYGWVIIILNLETCLIQYCDTLLK